MNIKTAQYTVGIDVGGTKTAYGLFDEDKNLVKSHRHNSDSEQSPEVFFDRIIENVYQMLEEQGITYEHLRGIGIGMPSYVRFEDGHIVKTVNLKNINEFPARNYLMKRMGGVRVLLDNDAHTGALAEYRNGAGRGFENMLYCPISTGISSGIIINGKVFRGRYGWAGESGHMIVNPDSGVECGCGNKGCLMSYCSGAMIVKHVQEWLAKGDKSILTEIAGGNEKINAFHISQAFEMNDEIAIRAIDQMAKYMGVWTYNLYITLNINCFVFGGGLLKMGDKLFKHMRQQFDEYNHNDMPVYFKKAELGDDFGIVGAAELLF